jgi:16S rRNA (guanine(966)-N(2))-methyltransferase RsmD
MRIVKGELKGRNIQACRGVRPASFRLKKAIFDILDDYPRGAVVLDLFAGCGSLGIEALSNGASRAYFVDLGKKSLKAINNNLTQLKILPRATIIAKDASKAIKDFHHLHQRFDLIFIDPPYYKQLLTNTLKTLNECVILSPSGLIVGLAYKDDHYQLRYGKLGLIHNKCYGQSRVLIYRLV